VSSRRLLAQPLLVALLLLGCADSDLRFSSPAATFQTYGEALASGDAETSWLCLSSGYRHLEYDDDAERWTSHVRRNGVVLSREVGRLEISQEMEINDRLAFLRFDASTVDPGRGPFYYFLHEPEGWKITTHLDSLFRVELENAIERGEFSLPAVKH
jgi:hypothetical protein